MIISKTSIPFSLIDNLTNFNRIGIEGVSFQTKDATKISLFSIYAPPSSNISRSKWSTLFENLPRNSIIADDFNSHHALWGSTSDIRFGTELVRAIEDEISY